MEKTWVSDLIIVWPDVCYKVTVCPECRKKHTIGELYEKIVKTLPRLPTGECIFCGAPKHTIRRV